NNEPWSPLHTSKKNNEDHSSERKEKYAQEIFDRADIVRDGFARVPHLYSNRMPGAAPFGFKGAGFDFPLLGRPIAISLSSKTVNTSEIQLVARTDA
ncbi:MAG: hypothetical protein WAM58_06340, partial [Candidatus Acidiferrum sp.]